jgi:glycerol kinase
MPNLAPYVLALDQGTTGSTALVLDRRGRVCGRGYAELPQHFPEPGRVEHDPERIWSSVLAATRQALAAARVPARALAAIGVTNQRETVVLWDRRTGEPLGRAIVWQDRRTAARCEALRRAGREPMIRRTTGLVCDPYFSATKLEWWLAHDARARRLAAAGRLAFGTVDSWLVWRLTGGAVHATDPTNASRTMLYGLRSRLWEPSLLRLFGVPASSAARGASLGGRLRPDARREGSARWHPRRGRRRRPAGGTVRPGLREIGREQEHVRHRLLPAAAHGRSTGRLARRTPHHARVQRRRRSGVRARG